jgi:hypothetical protein
VTVPMAVMVYLPVKTKNPLNGSSGNSRIAAVIRSRARAKLRAVTHMMVAAALARRRLAGAPLAPWRVRMTRVSSGRLDPHDGLGASLKGAIDGVADALGIDDGDESRLRFVLEQRKGKRGEYGVEVLLEPLGGQGV